MDPREQQRMEAFRRRLDSDPALRRQFEATPLASLRRAGVQVTPEKARRLHLELRRGVARDLRPSAFASRPFDILSSMIRRR